MADEEEKPGVAHSTSGKAPDLRYDYLQERVCSTLKVRDEQFQKLLTGEFK